MLQSFVGTFNAAGLRTLRNEDASDMRVIHNATGSVSFWAILDSDELPAIQHAITLGDRGAALQMLVQAAKSLGPVGE